MTHSQHSAARARASYLRVDEIMRMYKEMRIIIHLLVGALWHVTKIGRANLVRIEEDIGSFFMSHVCLLICRFILCRGMKRKIFFRRKSIAHGPANLILGRFGGPIRSMLHTDERFRAASYARIPYLQSILWNSLRSVPQLFVF